MRPAGQRFTGEPAVTVAYKHVGEHPVPPTRHTPAIPAPLEAVVLKAMAKEPDARYQSADEMRADLERIREGEPVAAGPATTAAAVGGPTDTVAMAPADATAVLDETAVHEAPPEA